MRLTWWYEALGRLDTAPPPAEPVLQALARHVVPQVGSATLATIAEGWEALLETPLDDAAVERFARLRGGQLFAAAASCWRCRTIASRRRARDGRLRICRCGCRIRNARQAWLRSRAGGSTWRSTVAGHDAHERLAH
ncbi:hypothetical protein [Sphingomonas sp. Ant20]|uniref:hypothetical protein n=1 Tax=Sphingomonas sp. Ant20 TaxID=104605 RepID=UPI000A920106|nr:hypothetical protein [Sphingomonas sp. Ant20]